MENDTPWREVARGDTSATGTIWSARDHRYGGLASRYKKGHPRLIRIMDPFTATPMQFSSSLRADNWLLRNFCPGAACSHIPAGGLRFLQHGKVRSVRCDLITDFRDGVQIADLVTAGPEKPDAESAKWLEFCDIALAFGIVPMLRQKSAIRCNLVLLCNLDRMCQHLLLHDVEDRRHEEQIRAAIPTSKLITVADLQTEMQFLRYPSLSPEQFDSALYRLYRHGSVSVNLAEVTYGPNSLVCQA